ncbi:MAG: MtaA/CmuA family methyltransferase [Thermoplasmata archaeon]|nr:MtaA/CmuA family methyltransferase [Thermoplasmata archaeon]
MDSRDRIMEALSGKAQDTPPVAIFTQSSTIGQMEATGASWPEAHRDPERMAKLGCAQAEIFGFESVRVPFDITAEAERLGCGVDLGTIDNPPFITSRVVTGDPCEGTLSELDLMDLSEYVSGGATAAVVEAVSLSAKRMAGKVAVCGGMLGPMGLLGQLMSVESLALASFMDPEWIRRSSSTLSALQAEYAKAMKDAGADVLLIVESEAGADIIDPSGYNDFSGSFMRSIIPSGDVKTVLHMCGSCEPILGEIADCGVDALSPDQKVPAETIIEGLGGRIAVAGSVDPVGTLLLGGPDKIRKESRMYAEAGYEVIAPGCGIAPNTSNTNMRAFAGAFRD